MLKTFINLLMSLMETIFVIPIHPVPVEAHSHIIGWFFLNFFQFLERLPFFNYFVIPPGNFGSDVFNDLIKFSQTDLVFLVVASALLCCPRYEEFRHLFKNLAFFSLGFIFENCSIGLHKGHKHSLLFDIPGPVVTERLFFTLIRLDLLSDGSTV